MSRSSQNNIDIIRTKATKQQTQIMLMNNAEVMKKIQTLHSKLQQMELLQFIQIEQSIMKRQLIEQRIPQLLSNIAKLKQNKNKSIQQIKNTKQETEKYKLKIIKAKQMAQKLYDQKRQLKYKDAKLLQQLNKLKQQNNTNKKVANSNMKTLQNLIKMKTMVKKSSDKQNQMSLANKEHRQTAATQCNLYNTQLLKNVSLKANNETMNIKIRQMKQQLKNKMQLLTQLKSQRKNLTDQLTNNYNYKQSYTSDKKEKKTSDFQLSSQVNSSSRCSPTKNSIYQ